jgi:hypothetical protein
MLHSYHGLSTNHISGLTIFGPINQMTEVEIFFSNDILDIISEMLILRFVSYSRKMEFAEKNFNTRSIFTELSHNFFHEQRRWHVMINTSDEIDWVEKEI